MGSIPGSGRSSGNGNLLQCCCLGNSMDRGAKWASLWGHKELKTMEQLSTGKNTSCFRRTQRCSDAQHNTSLLLSHVRDQFRCSSAFYIVVQECRQKGDAFGEATQLSVTHVDRCLIDEINVLINLRNSESNNATGSVLFCFCCSTSSDFYCPKYALVTYLSTHSVTQIYFRHIGC